MAISFPNRDLMDVGRYRSQTFRLQNRQELSRQAGGILRGRILGVPLWVAQFSTVPMLRAVAADLEALLDSTDGVANPVTVYDWRMPYPIAYADGVFSDTGAIASLPSTTSISLKSLPANFLVSRGDKFHFDDSGRRFLARAVESVTANGSGTTAVFEVRPALPPWAAVDKAVTFKKPSCRMVILPESIDIATEDEFTTISFSAAQTYAT